MSADPSTNRSPVGKGRARLDKDGLTLKQRLWIEAYTGAACGNATEAARMAGYNGDDDTLRNIGSENVAKLARMDLLQERISARIAESTISAAEVVGTLAAQARANIDDITDENGCVDLKLVKKLGLGHLVKSITPTKFGARVQLVSQFAALQQLCKVFGIEKAPSDGAREARDKALTAAANNLALMLGVTFEAAMERVRAAADARSGAVLALPAAGESSDAVS